MARRTLISFTLCIVLLFTGCHRSTSTSTTTVSVDSTDLRSNGGQIQLSCETPPIPPRTEGDLVRESSPAEAARLHQAPHEAKRIGKHQLQVAWIGGMQVFKDKPPYDEGLDGVQWAYCGYNPTVQIHLICKQDIDVFTGALIDDRTGRLLPGGETVLFSPDQQRYIAYYQPDGQDGETIKLYSSDGTNLWSGYNGLLSSEGGIDMVEVEFHNLRWDSRNRLLAEFHDPGGHQKFLVLTQGNNGQWAWLPTITK